MNAGACGPFISAADGSSCAISKTGLNRRRRPEPRAFCRIANKVEGIKTIPTILFALTGQIGRALGQSEHSARRSTRTLVVARASNHEANKVGHIEANKVGGIKTIPGILFAFARRTDGELAQLSRAQRRNR